MKVLLQTDFSAKRYNINNSSKLRKNVHGHQALPPVNHKRPPLLEGWHSISLAKRLFPTHGESQNECIAVWHAPPHPSFRFPCSLRATITQWTMPYCFLSAQYVHLLGAVIDACLNPYNTAPGSMFYTPYTPGMHPTWLVSSCM